MSRRRRSVLGALLAMCAMSAGVFGQVLADDAVVGRAKGEQRSQGREVADFVAQHGLAVEPGKEGPAPEKATSPGTGDRVLGNTQVNDAALDNIQAFAGTRPFEKSTQSETSIAAFGNAIVIGYNSSADQPIVATASGLNFVHRHFSGYSVSQDGGKTWRSGFVPPASGSRFTFGDTSVGVDRAGNFYFAGMGADAAGNGGIIVNRSTDGGSTFGPASIASLDNGADKPWLSIGPDPAMPTRDNIYVAWTNFRPNSSELWLARSTDGGTTWTSRQLFAPIDGGPNGLSASIQFANPTVDASTGRLYVPFLQFGNSDADFIKVLASDDAGETFRFLEFNMPGAPDRFSFPNVTPGTLADCGDGGVRLVLHQGPDLGGGRSGLPRFRQATRLITQPSAAAAQGKLFIAFNASTSPVSGDPSSRSEIRLLFSPDGGSSFDPPVTVAPASDADPQHVLPSLSVDRQAERVSITYYAQQADGRVRVDMASGHVNGDRVEFDPRAVQRVSGTAFDLVPSNNPLPSGLNPFSTTNYDRTVRPCYNLGEYIGTTVSEGRVLAVWGDNHASWTSPAESPAAGAHAQADVDFAALQVP